MAGGYPNEDGHLSPEAQAQLRRVVAEETGKAVAEETGKAVRAAFADIGLYPDDPEERREVREDFRHLRRWRQATDAMAIKVGNVVLMAVAGGMVAAMWVGIKVHLLKQP